MLSKGLKKFKDRIFSASRKEESFSGTDYSEGPESPGNQASVVGSPRATFRNLASLRSKNSSYADRELVASSSMRSNASAGHGPQTITLKEAPMLADHQNGGTVLPPVQINSNQNSFTAKAQQGPPSLANMFSPSSGRRKSTPAALDMVLRTAEGKAAVEHLLQPSQNKLVFGNYFAGTSAAARDQAAAVAAAEKQRAKAAAAASAGPTGPLLTPKPPAGHPPPLTLPSHKHSSSALQPHLNDPSMATVPEDVVMSDVVAPAAAEDASASNRTVGKLVSLSPQLPAAMQRKYWTLADYNIIRKMYTGYASTVYQAMCKKSLEMVALKVYHMQNLCELNHYQVFREIRVHSSLQHQNIIHLFAAFQEGTDVVLVQEYAEGGDLYRLLHKNGGRLSERQAVEMVLHPFLLALHYLHTRGIMHRDIKPENVLFTEHRVLKLADFGLAIDLTEERAVTRAGTLDYMAPEVLRCPPKNLPQENKNNPYLHYNNSVDAWAVGVFAYELIVGFPPFAGETQLDSVDRIMHSVPEFPAKISEFAKDFICQCLRKHPGDRPTVMELLHHPWVRTFQRRTSMRITAVPRRRSSVVYNPGSLSQYPHLEHSPYTPPQEAAEEGTDAAAPMETDMADMTPEQIEAMIHKLQVAKAQAIAKTGSQRVVGDVPMQAVHALQT
ncbi:hypothetical protein GPECTOR_5g78 [Gonium pectorale]|uniref:Protein kinase domain-containing protein n=1 Tax=Gonium pectorale TaxID=33097 RepID=A0A150GX81_GONPE|nr:hypothetical protein GPECTOR_5g78 [Gonium pectorale]|eukprot:KXZ54424.1 hypothetical protein GPECTOR_5g78 [Gonium pectorale]